MDESELEVVLQGAEQLKLNDPLADLRVEGLVAGDSDGQLNLMKLSPNFEITMYLAQLTGSCIVTDSMPRWSEIMAAIPRDFTGTQSGLSAFAHTLEHSEFAFLQDPSHVIELSSDKAIVKYQELMRQALRYLSNLGARGPKPNFEANLNSHLARIHTSAQSKIKHASVPVNVGRISCAFPNGGIQDNTVNRLLLMSSSERHSQNVPMAFFIK